MDTCEECGDEFARINQHYAMSDCGGDHSSKKEYKCSNCGDVFEDYPTRREINSRKNFFCSVECKDSFEREGETVECSWCGSECYRPPAQLNAMGDYEINNHFCDKECERNYKRTNWVRAGHPSWQGGKSGINAVRHMLSDVSWQETAREARELDKHTCQMCGEFGEERSLDVHHLIPVATGGTNERWNLITLCMSCHRKVERYTEKFTEPHLYRLSQKFGD